MTAGAITVTAVVSTFCIYFFFRSLCTSRTFFVVRILTPFSASVAVFESLLGFGGISKPDIISLFEFEHVGDKTVQQATVVVNIISL